MSFDAPQAEPALTRRSSRTAATPSPVSTEGSGAPLSESHRGVASPPAPSSRRARRLAANDGPVADAPALTPAPAPVLTPVEPFELLEPAAAASPTPAPAPASAATESPEGLAFEHAQRAASELDEFEIAARLFSFTAETPVQVAARAFDEQPDEVSADDRGHAASPRQRLAARFSFRRAATTSFSVGVMGIIGLLAVGMTTPAEALAASDGFVGAPAHLTAANRGTDLKVGADQIQAYVASSDAAPASLDRPESYTTVSMVQLGHDEGISNVSDFFVNNVNSPIQWPFAVGVPISYGFGQRDGEFHEGVDFTPGEGSPIQAIADGVVRVSTDDGGGYGVHIIIDHVIDGQLISSHYAHMLYGSRQVQVGDHVTVGTVIGHTGDTGFSFGAHTHFEILVNGTTPIDPLPWLREHAGG